MKRDLVMGWVFLTMALIMVFCIVVNCVNGAWCNIPICAFAMGLNINSAVNRFVDYKRRKEWAWQASLAKLDEGIQTCWPEYDEDISDEDNKITE